MLEIPKRKKIDKQDDTRPDNIEQLIEKYGLDNLWDCLETIVEYSNTRVGNDIIEKIYPVGSIYMSVNNTNPSILFGGTWVEWGSGRVPVGIDTNDTDFDTVEETGGEKTHNHGTSNLTAGLNTFISNGRLYIDYARRDGEQYVENKRVYAPNGDSDAHSEDSSSGLGVYGITDNESSLQPYITCYMWKRIS